MISRGDLWCRRGAGHGGPRVDRDVLRRPSIRPVLDQHRVLAAGLIAEQNGIRSSTLPRLRRPGGARLICSILGRMVDAAEASNRIRLAVNRVVPQDNLTPAVRQYGGRAGQPGLAAPAPACIKPRGVRSSLFQTLEQAIDAANEEMLKSFESPTSGGVSLDFIEKAIPRHSPANEIQRAIIEGCIRWP